MTSPFLLLGTTSGASWWFDVDTDNKHRQVPDDRPAPNCKHRQALDGPSIPPMKDGSSGAQYPAGAGFTGYSIPWVQHPTQGLLDLESS